MSEQVKVLPLVHSKHIDIIMLLLPQIPGFYEI